VTRANQIWRLPLHPDGTTSKVGAFITLSGGGGPDGMAIDEDGGLAVAHVGLGSVWLFNHLGEPQHRPAKASRPPISRSAVRAANLCSSPSPTQPLFCKRTCR